MHHILSHNKEDSNDLCVELIVILTRLTSQITTSSDPSPLQTGESAAFSFRLEQKPSFFFVKWKWQKMDGGRCRPTGGAVDPMLEPPVTVTDMQAVTGRNSCHSWWKTSDLLPLLWVNYVAFWKQLQSHHTRWVATVFGLNPLAKVPKQSFYTPSGSIWIVFLVLWFSKFL